MFASISQLLIVAIQIQIAMTMMFVQQILVQTMYVHILQNLIVVYQIQIVELIKFARIMFVWVLVLLNLIQLVLMEMFIGIIVAMLGKE
jgi:hypothetical protein